MAVVFNCRVGHILTGKDAEETQRRRNLADVAIREAAAVTQVYSSDLTYQHLSAAIKYRV